MQTQKIEARPFRSSVNNNQNCYPFYPPVKEKRKKTKYIGDFFSFEWNKKAIHFFFYYNTKKTEKIICCFLESGRAAAYVFKIIIFYTYK